MTDTVPAPNSEAPLRAHRRTAQSTRRRRVPWIPLVIAVVFLLGVAVLLYPSAAAWFTQYQQSQRIEALSDGVEGLAPTERADRIQDAVAYNETLTGGASVAANERIPLAEGGNAPVDPGSYESLLRADASGLMGRVKVPAIDVDLPIYHGTSDHVLEQGVGHLEGTALPVGGGGTHSVLTGHRGLAGAELFTNLDRVEVGDTFTIEVFGEVLTYRVRDKEVVEPTETETLYSQRGEDLMTLVTCTPLGVNSHRILITGERILPTPVADLDAAGERPDIPGFPWWAVALGGTVLVLGAYVWFSARPPRPARSQVERSSDDSTPTDEVGTPDVISGTRPMFSRLSRHAPRG